jgi:hypothetical protein
VTGRRRINESEGRSSNFQRPTAMVRVTLFRSLTSVPCHRICENKSASQNRAILIGYCASLPERKVRFGEYENDVTGIFTEIFRE